MGSNDDVVWRPGGEIAVCDEGDLCKGRWKVGDPDLIRVWYGDKWKMAHLGRTSANVLASVLFRELVDEDLASRPKPRR